MNRNSFSLRSVTEAKLPRRTTFRMIMPKTISIWFSHDVCFGKNTKRMRWPRSLRNCRRMACERSTPRLPFFSQVLLKPAGRRHALHQPLRGVDVQVVHHEHPGGRWVRGHRLGHVLDRSEEHTSEL